MNTVSSRSAPKIWSLIKVPALVTLGVTLARLFLELAEAPAWLANREAGGAGALLGIAWLPLIFGPLFAMRLAPTVSTTGKLVKRLLATLVCYGLLARIPVVLVTLLAMSGNWVTHYNAFPGEAADWSTAVRVGATLGFQLGFWAFVWTGLTGLLSGLLVYKFSGKKLAGAPAGP